MLRRCIATVILMLLLCFPAGIVMAQDHQISLPFDRSVEGVRHLPAIGPGATLSPQQASGLGVLGFREILASSAGRFLTMTLGTVALLFLFVAGYRLITAQEAAAEEVDKQRRAVLYIVMGLLIFALSSEVVYNYLYRGEGSYLFQEDTVREVASDAVVRIKRLLNLFLSFSGAGAILVLVVASLRLIINPGSDDMIEKQKKLVGYVATGIIMIGLADTIVNQIVFPQGGYFGSNVSAFEQQLRGLSNYILGFLGIVIFASFVLSGVAMVASFGNDDAISKVKTTLTNVVIGAFVAFSAYTVVASILSLLIQ